MTREKNKRGGVRAGAGRPAIPDSDKAKNRSIKLSDDDWDKFKRNGGAKWLRELLKLS